MSLKYRSENGTETPIAGLNGLSGQLIPSVALQQSGTYTPSSAVQAQEDLAFSVTFATPMPDADYLVDWWYGPSLSGVLQVAIRTRTTTGFSGVLRNVGQNSVSVQNCTFNWTAFKLMTDEVHEADAAAIAQNTANFAPTFSETTSYAVGDYCTYNGILYRCTTAHTAGVWVAGHFTAVTVGERLKVGEIVSNFNSLNTDATFESGVSMSDAYAVKLGRMVQFNINAITVSASKSAYNKLCTFSSSLPYPATTVFIAAMDVNTNESYSLYLSGRELHCRAAISIASGSSKTLVATAVYVS